MHIESRAADLADCNRERCNATFKAVNAAPVMAAVIGHAIADTEQQVERQENEWRKKVAHGLVRAHLSFSIRFVQ